MLQITCQQHKLHIHMSQGIVLSYLETMLVHYAILGFIHEGRIDILKLIAAYWHDKQIGHTVYVNSQKLYYLLHQT